MLAKAAKVAAGDEDEDEVAQNLFINTIHFGVAQEVFWSLLDTLLAKPNNSKPTSQSVGLDGPTHCLG